MKLTAHIIDRSQKEFNDYLAPYMKEMDKPRQKVLPELMEGILASGSSLVAQAARKVSPEHLETTERRFLRTLASPHWDETDLWVAHLRGAAREIREDTLITIDITDLAKPYAQKLEALAWVRDGSRKELTKGYWLLGINAALGEGRILPITHEVFSQEAEGFKSQNDLVFFWVECLTKLTKRKGIFVLDRGGDGDPTFDFFLDEKASFLIRIRENRLLLSEGIPVPLLTPSLPLPFSLRKILGKRHPNITFDWEKVRLPHREESLTLIRVKGFQDRKPILLLSNRVIRSSQDIAFLIDAYFERWEIEEAFRFLKQSFGWERFLIRSLRAIQRFFFLLCIAWGFLARILRFRRFQRLLEALSFSFPKKIQFFYYQWLRGLQFLFSLIHLLRFLEVL